MADYAFGRDTRTQGVDVERVFVSGEEAEFIFGRGSQIFPNLPVAIYGSTEVRTVTETDAFWFEFAFQIDTVLTGNSGAGFSDSGNYFRLECEHSSDLVNWSMGKFVPSPAGAVIDNGDGTRTYWSRSTTPIWWFNITVDLTITCDRYGKSITTVSIGSNTASLPGFPYAMPAEAARLESDLRAAGYTGAIVSSVAAPLSVGAKNHAVDGVKNLSVTLSGTNVTMVRDHYGTNISLPGYPYSMPSQRATLQADLRAAGQSGAVVMLYADEWTIFLPDRPAAGNSQRQSNVTFTPDDPFPAWDAFGAYLGNLPANAKNGTFGNVRAGVGGAPLPEANRQFARLKISPGTRYDPYR